MTSYLKEAERIIIKIGSALLIDNTQGEINRAWLDSLAGDIAALRQEGKEVLIVSSGAIALGRKSLGTKGPLKLEESQAAAAIGQIDLAHAYQDALRPHNIKTAQVLLTLGDTEERRRYLNARNTVETLLNLGIVPVVNENDTVATSEIRYGDNDRLAARVASMVSADCLVLLSDIDGLYTEDPRHSPAASHISEVSAITPQIEAMAGDAPRESEANVGSGGMITKISAAKIATAAGCHMVIASGRTENSIGKILSGAQATWFPAHENPQAARKRWIAGSLSPRGSLMVDDGAARAMAAGNSLLPAGILTSTGPFDRGDAVTVVSADGEEIARGLVAYGSDEVALLQGCQSAEIESRIGYRGRTSIIHRDDLVMTHPEKIKNKETVG